MGVIEPDRQAEQQPSIQAHSRNGGDRCSWS
jgi:hypothetical protein